MDSEKGNQSGKVSFADMLEESLKGSEQIEGRVVQGTIVSIQADKVLVDVGLKAEGRLSTSDVKALKGTDEISVGDTIDVYIERYEDRHGEPVLSIEKARKEIAWNDLEKCMEEGSTVDGAIVGHTRGGYSVDINGTLAFLPGSQVDLRMVRDISPLLNIKQPFKILKMDKVRNNIVVSRRAVLELTRAAARNEVMSKLEEGMIIEGVVRNITDYGAFVDIGGIDGLLHVTDMSWKRVSSPSSLVNVGDKVSVQILKFNPETGRISLGMKQLVKTPWEDIDKKYIVGNKYKGKVVNIMDYGVFVELESCIEGMIYVAELSWTKKNLNPSRIVTIGDEVDVVVLDVNPIKRKISLGYKQCLPNPWKEFAEKHPVGTKLKGVVRNITEFGVFVNIAEDLDGMVHASDLAWGGHGVTDSKLASLRKDMEIDVVVLDINPDKERISLGIKQLESDPYSDAVKKVKKGDAVVAEVTNTHAAGVSVIIENGLTGFIKKSDIAREITRQRGDALGIGEKVEALVIGIEKTGSVNLSIRALEVQREKEALAKFGSVDSGASLGDILGAAISSASPQKDGKTVKKAKSGATEAGEGVVDDLGSSTDVSSNGKKEKPTEDQE
jgi:small subunit ribosomal protein S1